MNRHIVNCLAVFAVALGASGLWAEEGAKPAEGTLLIGKKTYKLTHAVAYKNKVSDEMLTAVLLSDRAIPLDKLQNALKEGEGSDDSLFLFQPHVKVVFDKEGQASFCNAWADNTSISVGGGGLAGKLKLENGRVQGKVSLEADGEGQLRRSFDVALLGAGDTTTRSKPSTSDKPAAAVKPVVSGTFKGNGKEAKLAFVSAQWREPFNDKPSIRLVFTEKDQSKEKDPGFKAAFGDLGSALVISLHEDGRIFGCEVSHAGHEKRGFSSLGDIKTEEFMVADGRIEGVITTDGEVEAFGETWEVKIKFVAPLGQPPADSKPADDDAPKPTRPKTAVKPRTTDTDEPDPKPEPKPAAGPLNVKDLALPKDATDLEYKKLVEHLAFKSKSDVKTLAAELSKSLEKQGWKGDGSDLITPKSSILHRSRGEATLTIFVKPDGSGSQVTMFTEGLSWDDQ